MVGWIWSRIRSGALNTTLPKQWLCSSRDGYRLHVARWRIWLAAGVGLAPASDVVAALAGMDRRSVRQVRRLVRRGLVAPDAPRARLAVALARDVQRRQSSRLLSMLFAAFVVGLTWFFVRRLAQDHLDLLTLFWGAATAWGIWMVWALWRMRRGAPQAELRNLAFLRDAGEPSPSETECRPTRVPLPAVAASACVAFVYYDLGFGALTLAGDGRALSISRVVGHGALFAALMSAVNLTIMRKRNEQQTLRSTAGQPL